MLFLDVIIEDDKGENEASEEENVPYDLSKEAVVLDMKVQDIKVSFSSGFYPRLDYSLPSPQKRLNDIGARLSKVITQQQFFKARESRHRHTLDSNHARVFWWSFLEISIIVTVGVIQVSGWSMTPLLPSLPLPHSALQGNLPNLTH